MTTKPDVNDSHVTEKSVSAVLDCFEIRDDGLVYCNICLSTLKTSGKSGQRPQKDHLTSAKHLKNLRLLESQHIHADQSKLEYNKATIIWMIKNRIPLSRLAREEFTNHLEKFTGRLLFSSSHCQKNILPVLFKNETTKWINEIKNKPFYLMFDESPDRMSRKLLNIMIGTLDPQASSKPFLIDVIEIETANAETIVPIILFNVNRVFASASQTTNFKLLLSDRAAYCLKVGRILKTSYPDLKHVTCICHGLHNFAETLRNRSPAVDKFVSEMKRILHKNNKLKKEFKKQTNLKLPKFPVLTRWGTWLAFVKWLYSNLVDMECFFDNERSKCLKAIYNTEEFDKEIIKLEHYFEIPDVIKSLEASNLSIYDQIQAIQKVKKCIKEPELQKRFDEIFITNPDFGFFEKFVGAKSREKYFTFAPLNTCWVERSFSKLKLILSDQRNLSIETLRSLLTIDFNDRPF